ncbi:hypothetical protein WICPIJ_009073 [Wickerhamomyces pijperi]|uniref:SH3 domain-containing protein n=1 Tax=Wickerhamomyces pijperi TaxID=599730 RepID=A0A9P8PQK7_WICPI|nr:hypothetical protein WICPIJ_009073 [Wickerhamomyces pijperi]
MDRLPPLPFLVRTLYAKGDSDSNGEDLAFHEHEIIKVTSLGDGNWWKGTMFRNKTSGFFPKNYVELVEDTDKEPKSSSSPSSPEKSSKQRDTMKESSMQRSRNHSHEDVRDQNMDFSFQSSRNYYREDPNDPYAPPGPYSSNSSHRKQSHHPQQHSTQRSPMRSSKQPHQHMQHNHQMHQGSRQMNYSNENLNRSAHQRSSFGQGVNKATPPPPPTHTRTTPSPPPSTAHVQYPLAKQGSPQYQSPMSKPSSMHPHSHSQQQQFYQMESQQQYRQQAGLQRPSAPDNFISNSNSNSHVSLSSKGQLPNIPSNVNTTLHFSTYPSPPSSKQSHPHPPNGTPSKGEYTIPYTADSLGQSSSANNSSNNLNGQSANFTYSQGTYFQNSLNSNSSSAMFGMSDFSATSAGSFSRHRYEEQLRLSQMNNSASGNNLLVDERKVKNGRGFIKRFFGGGSNDRGVGDATPALPFNILGGANKENLNGTNEEMQLWLRSKAELHRSATLSIEDRKLRERRIRETEGEVILEPHKGISKFNENEVLFGSDDSHLKVLDLEGIDFQEVDISSENLDWNLFHSNAQAGPEGIIRGLGRFRTRIEYVRAIFKFCQCYFDVCVDSPTISSDKDLLYTRDDIVRFIQQRKIDSLSLAKVFKSLIDLLKLPCEIVPGVMKLPTVPVRHYWNTILISGEWRMVDVWTPNIHNPQSREFISDYYTNGQNYADFYFLNQPLSFIHTHIPISYEHQHINPPINDRIAHQLPPCFPAFFQNGLEISRFNNSLTRLQDSEMFELDLKIPNDIELNTTVLTPKGVFDCNSLCQVYWSQGQRYAKVKGCLPAGDSTGFINISVGIKGIQLTPVNPHALAMVIPMTHSGNASQFNLLTRMPHYSTSSTNDLYVKQPQNRVLVCGTDYIFNVLSHAFANSEQSSRFVIAIETPSSRVIRLDVKSTSNDIDGYVNWSKTLRCDEIGIWRGLVSVDPSQGSGLCVFAEWSCER